MTLGYDATASLTPLNYTGSFLNPTAATQANLGYVNAQQQMVNNPQSLYGGSGFGSLTDYYSQLGAAYGRNTGGFNAQQPMGSVFDTGAQAFPGYGAGGSPYGGGGFGGGYNPADDPNSPGRQEQQRNDPEGYNSWLGVHNRQNSAPNQVMAQNNSLNQFYQNQYGPGGGGWGNSFNMPQLNQMGGQGFGSSYNPADDPNSPGRQEQMRNDPEEYNKWLQQHNNAQGGSARSYMGEGFNPYPGLPSEITQGASTPGSNPYTDFARSMAGNAPAYPSGAYNGPYALPNIPGVQNYPPKSSIQSLEQWQRSLFGGGDASGGWGNSFNVPQIQRLPSVNPGQGDPFFELPLGSTRNPGQ